MNHLPISKTAYRNFRNKHSITSNSKYFDKLARNELFRAIIDVSKLFLVIFPHRSKQWLSNFLSAFFETFKVFLFLNLFHNHFNEKIWQFLEHWSFRGSINMAMNAMILHHNLLYSRVILPTFNS